MSVCGRRDHGRTCRECAHCRQVYRTRWKKRNPEKVMLMQRKYYWSKPEICRARSRYFGKRYYAKNKSRCKLRSKLWATENREKVRQTKRRWNLANIEVLRASKAKYRRTHLKECREGRRRRYWANRNNELKRALRRRWGPLLPLWEKHKSLRAAIKETEDAAR